MAVVAVTTRIKLPQIIHPLQKKDGLQENAPDVIADELNLAESIAKKH